MVKVIVADRQMGKTTKLIDWLLAGHEIPEYPGWSRAILCFSSQRVLQVTSEVRKRASINIIQTEHVLSDPRKMIWSTNDLQMIFRGRDLSNVEYAIDDWDLMFYQVTGVAKTPTLVSITGEIYVNAT